MNKELNFEKQLVAELKKKRDKAMRVLQKEKNLCEDFERQNAELHNIIRGQKVTEFSLMLYCRG